MTETLNAALARAVAKWPDRVFLKIDGIDVTFAEFDDASGRLAAGLAAAGLRAGDRLAVCMRNSLACLHTWFAANRLGAVWTPVNTEFRGPTLEHALALVDASLFVVDTDLADVVVPALDARRLSPRLVVHPRSDAGVAGGELLTDFYATEPVPVVDVEASSQAGMLFTSGTTGPSKACILSHAYFVTQATVLVGDFGLRDDDVLYCPFPLYHADATALTTVPALLLGATAVIAPRFSVSQFWDEVRESGSTVFDFMGATLSMLWKAPPRPDDADNPVRLAWGVPVPPEWAADFERRFGLTLVELYGSVEASVPVTQGLRPRVPGSCGRVTEEFEVRIHDAADNPVPPGESGEIVIRPRRPGVILDGYFGMPDATVEAFRNLWFHSGDIGRLDEDGNLYFLGRRTDSIRRRGENISAFEVEEGLLLHPDVVECAAVGVPSELTEEEVKVYVTRRPDSRLTPEALVEHCRETMARFQVPRYVEFVDEIPKTPTGKLAKHLLSREPETPDTWDSLQ